MQTDAKKHASSFLMRGAHCMVTSPTAAKVQGWHMLCSSTPPSAIRLATCVMVSLLTQMPKQAWATQHADRQYPHLPAPLHHPAANHSRYTLQPTIASHPSMARTRDQTALLPKNPATPDHPWHNSTEGSIKDQAQRKGAEERGRGHMGPTTHKLTAFKHLL